MSKSLLALKIAQLLCNHNWVYGMEFIPKSKPMTNEEYVNKDHTARHKIYNCTKCNKKLVVKQ